MSWQTKLLISCFLVLGAGLGMTTWTRNLVWLWVGVGLSLIGSVVTVLFDKDLDDHGDKGG